MSQPHSGSKTPGQRNGYSYCWSKYKHYATVFLLEVKLGRLCGHMSRLKYSTVVSYPELCSCACRVGARSPERTSTGSPLPCWYSPGCSSLLRHIRPHLERTKKDRVMLASSSRRVNNEFKTKSREEKVAGRWKTHSYFWKKNIHVQLLVYTFWILKCCIWPCERAPQDVETNIKRRFYVSVSSGDKKFDSWQKSQIRGPHQIIINNLSAQS